MTTEAIELRLDKQTSDYLLRISELAGVPVETVLTVMLAIAVEKESR